MPLSSVVGAQSIVKPGVCTSSTRPASPYEGQMIYETDTDGIFVFNGTSWIPYGIRQTFTPVFTGFTLGNGTVNYATYLQIGDFVLVEMKVTLGSTSTMGTGSTFNLPVTSTQQTSVSQLGTARYEDVGVANWAGLIYSGNGSSTAAMGITNVSGTYPSFANVTATVPFTWGSGDIFEIMIYYTV